MLRLMHGTLIVLGMLFTISCSERNIENDLLKAEAALSAGRYQEAVVALKGAASESPSNGMVRAKLAKASLLVGDLDAAEKEALIASKLNGPDDEITGILAVSLYYQGKSEEIVALAKQFEQPLSALDTIPLLSSLSFERVPTSMTQTLESTANDSHHGRFIQVVELVKDGEYKKALDAISSGEFEWYYQPILTHLSSNLLFKSGNYTEAKVELSELAHRWEGVSYIALTYIEVLIANGDYDQAGKWLSRRLDSGKSNVWFSLLMADLQLREGHYSASFDYAVDAINRGFKSNYEANLIAGISGFQLGKMEVAFKYLKIANSIEPNERLAKRYLAKTKLELGYIEEASELLKQVKLNSENDIKFLLDASQSLRNKGYPDNAGFVVANVLKTHEDSVPLLYELAANKLEANQDITGIIERIIDSGDKEGVSQLLAFKDSFAKADYGASLEIAKALSKSNSLLSQRLQAIALYSLGKCDTALVMVEQLLASFRDDQAMLKIKMLCKRNNSLYREAMESAVRLIELTRTMASARDLIFLLEESKDEDTFAFIENIVSKKDGISDLLWAALTESLVSKGLFEKSYEIISTKTTQNMLPPLVWMSVLVDLQKWNEAEQYASEITGTDEAPVSSFLTAVSYLFERNELNKALQMLNRAEAMHGDNVDIALAKFELYLRQGAFEQAKVTLDRIDSRKVPEAALLAFNAQRLLLEGDTSQALKLIEKSYSLSPIGSTALTIAKIYSVKNEPLKGLAALKRHFLTEQIEENSYHIVAEYAVSHGLISIASDLYSELLSKWPSSHVALNNIANLYVRQKKLDKAHKAITRAIEIDDNPAYHETLGWVLILRGNVESGVTLLEKVVAAFPLYEEAALHLAVGYTRLGKTESAAELKQKFNSEASRFSSYWDKI